VAELLRGETVQREIAKVEKNGAENIIVQLTEWQGRDLVDVRVWNKPLPGEKDAKGIPTKKGLTFKPDILPELIEALQKAEREYQISEGNKEA
jgi:hypothetical protein